MSTGEQVDEQLRPRRASERRSSLEQIEALKVRRASERRASVELSAELVDPARTRRASERRSSLTQIEELKVRRASERRRSSVELSSWSKSRRAK